MLRERSTVLCERWTVLCERCAVLYERYAALRERCTVHHVTVYCASPQQTPDGPPDPSAVPINSQGGQGKARHFKRRHVAQQTPDKTRRSGGLFSLLGGNDPHRPWTSQHEARTNAPNMRLHLRASASGRAAGNVPKCGASAPTLRPSNVPVYYTSRAAPRNTNPAANPRPPIRRLVLASKHGGRKVIFNRRGGGGCVTLGLLRNIALHGMDMDSAFSSHPRTISPELR